MIKAVFFDIDGTLLSHRIKDVPESTRQALEQLSELKIDRVIATGRHMTAVEELPVKDIRFDAYITLNGQICLDADGNIFYENPLQDTDEILALFSERKIPVMLIEKEQMYINFINEDVQKAHESINTPLPVVKEYTGNLIYQAIIFVKDDEQAEVTKNLKNVEITRWNPCAVDLIPSGGSKMAGIRKYLDMKQYLREETAAFGDAENDVEMLEYVGKGVAMGNADDFVKSRSAYVTTDIDDDGVMKGLQAIGLI